MRGMTLANPPCSRSFCPTPVHLIVPHTCTHIRTHAMHKYLSTCRSNLQSRSKLHLEKIAKGYGEPVEQMLQEEKGAHQHVHAHQHTPAYRRTSLQIYKHTKARKTHKVRGTCRHNNSRVTGSQLSFHHLLLVTCSHFTAIALALTARA